MVIMQTNEFLTTFTNNRFEKTAMKRQKTKRSIFFAKKICQFKNYAYLCIAFAAKPHGRLAQLVQSVCLTSRGSGVRIPQRPPPSIKPIKACTSAGFSYNRTSRLIRPPDPGADQMPCAPYPPCHDYWPSGSSSLKTRRCTPFCQRQLVMRKRPISAVCLTCAPAHRH